MEELIDALQGEEESADEEDNETDEEIVIGCVHAWHQLGDNKAVSCVWQWLDLHLRSYDERLLVLVLNIWWQGQ